MNKSKTLIKNRGVDMTISKSIEQLEERLAFAQKEYSNVTKDYKLALLTAIECMKKIQSQVHCRDCIHWGTGGIIETDMVKCCQYAGYMVGNNGYCCYGERESDNS